MRLWPPAQRLGFDVKNGPMPFSIDTTTVLARADVRFSPNDTSVLAIMADSLIMAAFEPFGGLIANTNSGIRISMIIPSR